MCVQLPAADLLPSRLTLDEGESPRVACQRENKQTEHACINQAAPGES
jgi:hypothetical protein